MSAKPPGVEGIGIRTHIDKGTLVRNASSKPGFTGSGSTLEGISQSIALTRSLGNSNIDNCLVAVVYFKTDEHKVNADDRRGLQDLVKSLKARLKDGFTISLKCTGGADYRASRGYNKRLGQRRADSVEIEIKNMIQSKGLKISTDSTGEKYASQPVGGKRLPLISIVNDRHVKVTTDRNGYIAPITIAVIGTWFINASIETKELNNNGRIVSAKDVSKKEREYQERRGIKRNENDPFLPSVIIETNFSITNVGGKEEGIIRCKVIYVKTKKVLFTAFAKTDSNKAIKEILHFDPSNPRVKRAVVPGHTNSKDLKGRATKERVVKGVRERAAYLVDTIYNQLKGSYKNISKRVDAEL